MPSAAWTKQKGSVCSIQIYPTMDNYYHRANTDQTILGQAFLRNYVTTFDFTTKKIQVIVNINAPDGVDFEIPPDTSLTGWAIFGIVAASIFALIVIVWLVYCYIKRPKGKLVGEFSDGTASQALNAVSSGEEDSDDD